MLEILNDVVECMCVCVHWCVYALKTSSDNIEIFFWTCCLWKYCNSLWCFAYAIACLNREAVTHGTQEGGITRKTKMQLPQFRSTRARKQEGEVGQTRRASSSDRTLTPTHNNDGVNVKRATKARKIWILLSCFCFAIATIFLLLVSSPSSPPYHQYIQTANT